MKRDQLGAVTKHKGEKASIVGIFNNQGAIDQFNHVKSLND